MPNVFAIPVFFICFRECLETSIIVSILLAFVKQTLGPDRDPVVYKKLVRQIWFGTLAGLLICICIGAGMIGAFYGLSTDRWSSTENIWEGVFALIASLIITVMGAALLRITKLQDKWRVKLHKALETRSSIHGNNLKSRIKTFCEKYAMFMLPFVTVLREGLEAVVFIGGVGVGLPATAFPLAVICVGIFEAPCTSITPLTVSQGLLAGAIIGFIIYKGGKRTTMQIFLIISTCFLYLVAAGLFSKAVWNFEMNEWNRAIGGDAAETGSGPGSYDIRQSVWHVNCCSPELNGGGGWGVFNSLFGWQNSATYGSVISYNLYWFVIIVGFLAAGYKERRGQWPLIKSTSRVSSAQEDSESNSQEESEKALGVTAAEVR